MWFPLVASLVLYAVIAFVFWGVWKPFTDELKENPAINIPVIGVMLAVALVPPLIWAIAAL